MHKFTQYFFQYSCQWTCLYIRLFNTPYLWLGPSFCLEFLSVIWLQSFNLLLQINAIRGNVSLFFLFLPLWFVVEYTTHNAYIFTSISSCRQHQIEMTMEFVILNSRFKQVRLLRWACFEWKKKEKRIRHCSTKTLIQTELLAKRFSFFLRGENGINCIFIQKLMEFLFLNHRRNVWIVQFNFYSFSNNNSKNVQFVKCCHNR